MALVLLYWICEAHGKTHLLRLTLIRLRTGRSGFDLKWNSRSGKRPCEYPPPRCQSLNTCPMREFGLSSAIASFKGEDVPYLSLILTTLKGPLDTDFHPVLETTLSNLVMRAHKAYITAPVEDVVVSGGLSRPVP